MSEKDTITNFEFVKNLNQPQLTAFIVLQIEKFLESQGLSLDKNSENALIDTYTNWFDQECNASEIDLGKE